MATDEAPRTEPDLGEQLASLFDAYDRLQIPAEQYLLLIVAPATVIFFLSVVIAVVVELPLLVRIPIPILGLLVFGAAVGYPRLLMEQERAELNNRLHLLITHMTVLSTTNINRMEVFRTLAAEREYKALAREMQRIVQLVDTWNQSLDDACRRRARETPSGPLADFLDRLSYTLGAGQPLSDFLLSEQGVIIQNYITVYEGSLENLEVMQDLYLSMILSMTFGLVFAVVLPVLTGTDPTLTVTAVIVIFVFVQLGFYLLIRVLTPYDPVWYEAEDITPRSEPRIRAAFAVGALLSVLIVLVMFVDLVGLFRYGLTGLVARGTLPLPILAVIPLTPLVIPGLIVRSVEQEIKGRDSEFPSFIRALGASESAKQSTTSDVLKDLRRKDFGPLTADVDNLYKRLNMRIEPAKAWRYFAADTQSYLIQKFSEMYLIGRQMGGSPKKLGELISQNMNEVIQLRKRRDQATLTLIGLLYGITAASTFAFFLGLAVVGILANLAQNIEGATAFDSSQIIHTGAYDIQTTMFLLLIVVLFNALLSSLMIRTVDGGHKVNSYLHFVSLALLSAVIAVSTQWLVESFLVIG